MLDVAERDWRIGSGRIFFLATFYKTKKKKKKGRETTRTKTKKTQKKFLFFHFREGLFGKLKMCFRQKRRRRRRRTLILS